MKRLLQIIALSKNEQRVVLIAMFVLITIAFVSYERRVRHPSLQATAAFQPKPSASPSDPERQR
jgi:hypothetical protein